MAITDLIEAVERGKWDALDVYPPEVWQPIEDAFGTEGMSEEVFLAYDGDLNAAVALLEAVLPGWRVKMFRDQMGAGAEIWGPGDVGDYRALDKLLSRALLLAILKALAAKETTDD